MSDATNPDRTDATNRAGDWLLAGIALASVILHVAVLRSYGWFRDEFYYVVCGRHLDFGYVDHPPLVALVARLVTSIFGDSLAALRMVAVLAGAAVIWLAGRIAREIGGGTFAQGVAALCVLIAPTYLFNFHEFSLNCLDVLFWTLGAFVVVRILKTGNPRLWLVFGLLMGLGLENKYSVLFFGFGVFAALLLTPERRWLRTPWPWLGGGIALLLWTPNLIWEVVHGGPTLEFMRNATAHKNVALSPVQFFQEQILQMHPVTFPLWLAGLAWCVFARTGRPWRALGWIYLVAFAVLATQNSKAYYLAPAYPMLFAAGATALAAGIRRPGWRWLRPVVVVLLVASGIATAPLTLPVLPVDTLVRYLAAMNMKPSSGEKKVIGDLPQYYADMFGWPELVAELARVYRSLPPEEQARAVVVGQNYGEAGAVDVLGRPLGLPPAASTHNNYFLWGPPPPSRDIAIVIGAEEEGRRLCNDFRPAGKFHCEHCMPYENDQTISICRGSRVPFAELWPRLKHFD